MERLLSETCCARWVGLLGNPIAGSEETRLVAWQAQSANSHPGCFGWLAGSHELTIADAGLYELSAGIWPGIAS